MNSEEQKSGGTWTLVLTLQASNTSVVQTVTIPGYSESAAANRVGEDLLTNSAFKIWKPVAYFVVRVW